MLKRGKSIIFDVYMKRIIKEIQRIGQILKKHYYKINNHDDKEPGHLLAEADLEIHRQLTQSLSKLYPGVPIDSEEDTQKQQNNSNSLIIDPIDGTNNFLCGRPFFAISVALQEKGKIQWGLVYNPLSEELFFADRSQSQAFYNRQSIKTPHYRPLNQSLFVLGMSYDPTKYTRYVNKWQGLLNSVKKCFFETAPALSICNAALGRIQGYIDSDCSRHGQSAASLVLQMAGGSCMDYNLCEYQTETKGGVFLSAHMKNSVLAAIS